MKLQIFRMAYKSLADLAPAHVPTLPTLLKLGQQSHLSSRKSQAPAHGHSALAAPSLLRTARPLPAPCPPPAPAGPGACKSTASAGSHRSFPGGSPRPKERRRVTAGASPGLCGRACRCPEGHGVSRPGRGPAADARGRAASAGTVFLPRQTALREAAWGAPGPAQGSRLSLWVAFSLGQPRDS